MGVETAMTLFERRGVKTTVVEMQGVLAPESDGMAQAAMLDRVAADGIEICLCARVTKIEKGSVWASGANGRESFTGADTVLLLWVQRRMKTPARRLKIWVQRPW